MNTTKVFLYHQRHRVILLDTTNSDIFSRRYNQVYTKNLIAHRGTDNRFLLEFVNQDQKRVDLSSLTTPPSLVIAGSFVIGQNYKIETQGTTDFTLYGAINNVIGQTFTATGVGTGTGTAATIVYKKFTCRLISHDGEKLILEKPLVMVNATAGQTKLVLTEQELDLIAPGKVGWSVEQTLDGSLYEPVYMDDFSSSRGVMDIVDSIMPAFINSEVLTIPDPTGQVGYPPEFKTSILNTDAADLHTFQFTLDQFIGDILVEGAADTDGAWYTIQTENIVELSELHTFSISGYHPYLRFVFTSLAGTVIQIIYR